MNQLIKLLGISYFVNALFFTPLMGANRVYNCYDKCSDTAFDSCQYDISGQICASDPSSSDCNNYYESCYNDYSLCLSNCGVFYFRPPIGWDLMCENDYNQCMDTPNGNYEICVNKVNQAISEQEEICSIYSPEFYEYCMQTEDFEEQLNECTVELEEQSQSCKQNLTHCQAAND